MADRYTLRRYLMFMAIIQHQRNPTRAVDRLLRQNPDWDENETRSWEAWRSDFTPTFNGARPIETAEVKEGPLS
jgi:hypothetical protein